ncbi:response regulator [Sulfurimonas sp. MAG313]|nr:response regulator [Sulfurimonas sp. MAG313]MDF1881046.1 response regulator [Sulfurimonas sp. MAG313]
MNNENELLFDIDEEDELEIVESLGTWRILIVDDEEQVHIITKLALTKFMYDGKTLEFLHAYSAKEAKPILDKYDDIAMVLLDVVMETNHAGLDLVQYIREEANNTNIRIVLRTGQPGQAPERKIIAEYDINDYVDKAELSAQKLFTVVVSSLRGYKDIMRLEDSKLELIQANTQLWEERQRIQVTLDSIGDAVFTTDAFEKVTHLNPIAERLTGWSISEARGHELSEVFNIVNTSTNAKVQNPVAKVLSTGEIVELANHTTLISKDGTKYHIADSAAPIRDESGEIQGVILVCRDVSQSYQTEEALRRSQKMEAIGQLSGGIAHDFNNQLGVIIGYLDFLEESYTPEDKKYKWVKTASKATLRCMDLTRQLLAFSRKQVSDITPLNLNEQVKDMQTMLERSLTPEIEIKYFLDEDLWMVDTNIGEFQDAVLNLVINAKDAMPEGGTLIVEIRNKVLDKGYVDVNPEGMVGNYVQVLISDTGVGMDTSTQERVYEPFFTTKPVGKGTGLGMSMVYGFVKRYNGFVKIYSEVNIGTTIRLYLPQSKNEIKCDIENSIKEELPKGEALILVVDDEANLLELAQHYLQSLGYKTIGADNAPNALKLLEEHNDIDMLFSDVVMPGGMNGYELAKVCSENYPKLKILLTSGFTSKSIIKNDNKEFSKTLLTKPYRKLELAKAIASTLENG